MEPFVFLRVKKKNTFVAAAHVSLKKGISQFCICHVRYSEGRGKNKLDCMDSPTKTSSNTLVDQTNKQRVLKEDKGDLH